MSQKERKRHKVVRRARILCASSPCCRSFYLGRQTSVSLKAPQIVWGAKFALRRLCQTQDLIWIIHLSCIWSVSCSLFADFFLYTYSIYLLLCYHIFLCYYLFLDLYLILLVNPSWYKPNNLKANFRIYFNLFLWLLWINVNYCARLVDTFSLHDFALAFVFNILGLCLSLLNKLATQCVIPYCIC